MDTRVRLDSTDGEGSVVKIDCCDYDTAILLTEVALKNLIEQKEREDKFRGIALQASVRKPKEPPTRIERRCG